MSGDEIQRQLAAVLDDTATGLWMGHSGPGWGHVVAAALLPVVQALVAEGAAAELEIVRQWLMETGRADADTLQQLRERIGQHREPPK